MTRRRPSLAKSAVTSKPKAAPISESLSFASRFDHAHVASPGWCSVQPVAGRSLRGAQSKRRSKHRTGVVRGQMVAGAWQTISCCATDAPHPFHNERVKARFWPFNCSRLKEQRDFIGRPPSGHGARQVGGRLCLNQGVDSLLSLCFKWSL